MAVEDLTHLLGKEEGSAFDFDSLLFNGYQDGGVFNYDNTTFAHDIKEMLYGEAPDAKAQTLVQVNSLPGMAAPWSIQKGRSEQATYDYVHKVFTENGTNGGMSTPLQMVIAQMFNADVYKKAFFEKVWVADEDEPGRVKYDKIAFRPATTCAVERDPDTGSFKGFRQMPIRLEDTDEKRFKAIRAFVYIHGTDRDPLEGISTMTVPLWCYRTKQKIRFLWYSFLEGQALPKTIVRSQDETIAQAAAKKLIGLRQGGVVGVGGNIDEIKALESSGKGAAEFKAAMQFLDSEASASNIAGFTDLGAMAASGTGSFALSKDQTDFFLMGRQANARDKAYFINHYLIAPLVYWNFGPKAIAPYFEFGPIAQDDAASAISLLQATAQTPVNQSVLPQEFFDELTLRVAGHLDLDVVTVRKGLDDKRKEAEERAALSPDPGVAANPQVAGVKAVVDTATNALQQRSIADARDKIIA